MKKLLFGLMACVTLLAVSCDNNTAEDEQLYETSSIDKEKLRIGGRGK